MYTLAETVVIYFDKLDTLGTISQIPFDIFFSGMKYYIIIIYVGSQNFMIALL